MATIQEIPLTRIDGAITSLQAFAGKVLLIVNVASKCGLTPQYQGLEALYQAKKDEGFALLAFPANNFAGQEPGSNDEIASFCSVSYDIHFPLFAKISVVGDDQHPLYTALTEAQPIATGEGPMRERLASKGRAPNPPPQVLWNFEKFLVDRQGQVVGRFAPDISPDDPRLVAAIDAAIAR